MTRGFTTCGVLFAAFGACSALADTAVSVSGPWWTAWSNEPAVIAALFFVGALYVAGLRSLRRATGAKNKLRREAWCYGAGWTMAAIALVSPVHPWGQIYFSVHMVQHELMMVLAAPLLVLGRPALVLLSALPRSIARDIVGGLRRIGGGRVWEALTNPFVAWLVHALALWIWHAPALFESTLQHEGWHALQHVSFLGSALLFWQAVIHGPRRRFGYGMGVLYLFTTGVHSGALGALLTFASRVWYGAYVENGGVAGLSALEDQQLGGLIMWIPAGIVYVIAGLILFAAWLRASDHIDRAPPAASSPLPCTSRSL